MKRQRNPERGSAMLVTLIIIGALLAGGAVLVSLQLSANRSTDLTKSGMSALYCAEAGLSAARPYVANHYLQWPASIAASGGGSTAEPAWLNTLIGSAHDLANPATGTNVDFQVYLADNGDEGTAADDPTVDNDLQIFIVSKCLKYPDTPKEVRELVLFNGGTNCNPEQLGGQDGNANKNDGC